MLTRCLCVVVLAGSDAKPGLIATAVHGDRYLTLKPIGNGWWLYKRLK